MTSSAEACGASEIVPFDVGQPYSIVSSVRVSSACWRSGFLHFSGRAGSDYRPTSRRIPMPRQDAMTSALHDGRKSAAGDRKPKCEVLVWIETLREAEIAPVTEANTAVCEGGCAGGGEPRSRQGRNHRKGEHGWRGQHGNLLLVERVIRLLVRGPRSGVHESHVNNRAFEQCVTAITSVTSVPTSCRACLAYRVATAERLRGNTSVLRHDSGSPRPIVQQVSLIRSPGENSEAQGPHSARRRGGIARKSQRASARHSRAYWQASLVGRGSDSGTFLDDTATAWRGEG